MFQAAAEWCRRLLLARNEMADIFDEFQKCIKKLNDEKFITQFAAVGRWRFTACRERRLTLIYSFYPKIFQKFGELSEN